MPSAPRDPIVSLTLGVPIEVPPPPILLSLGCALPGVLLGAIATALYIFDPTSRSDGVVVWGGLSALSFVVMAISLIRRARLRVRATLLIDGFTLGSQTFRFDEVESLWIGEKVRLANGKPIGFDRSIVVQGFGRRAKARYFAGGVDPLRAFTIRLVDGIVPVAERGLDRGIRGVGWQLSVSGLTAYGRTTRIDEIDKVGMFDGALRLWARGEEQPFVSIPADSENAVVLFRILDTRVNTGGATPPPASMPVDGGRSGPGVAPAISGELGRLLFVREPQQLLGVLTALIGSFSLGIPFAWMELKTDEEVIGAIVLTIASPLCLAFTFYIFTITIRFHEHGIVKKSIYGSLDCAYATIERMTWAETRLYVNGSYAGMTYKVKLFSSDKEKPLRFTLRRDAVDPDLSSVRDTIARHVAALMERQLGTRGRVPWGPSASLTFDGLEIARKPNDPSPERYPWTIPLELEVKDGLLWISRPDSTKPLLTISTAAENLLPGMMLMRKLTSRT